MNTTLVPEQSTAEKSHVVGCAWLPQRTYAALEDWRTRQQPVEVTRSRAIAHILSVFFFGSDIRNPGPDDPADGEAPSSQPRVREEA